MYNGNGIALIPRHTDISPTDANMGLMLNYPHVVVDVGGNGGLNPRCSQRGGGIELNPRYGQRGGESN